MLEGLSYWDIEKKLEATLTLAQSGDFSGLNVILEALSNDNREVRLEAAYCCERIGFYHSTGLLTRIVKEDRALENRNEAMLALASTGRPVVISPLLAALNDPDPDCRENARVALFWVLGDPILHLLPDDLLSYQTKGDLSEATGPSRVAAWWAENSTRFNPTFVYARGELASPGVFIHQLKRTKSSLPDALLIALRDWTGKDFGQSPLPKVVKEWEKWWTKNEPHYEPGRRYYYGHVVPH